MRLPVWGQWTSAELASPALAGAHSRTADHAQMACVLSRSMSFPFGGVWLGCVGSCGAQPAPRRQVLPASGDAGGRGRGAGRYSANELWSAVELASSALAGVLSRTAENAQMACVHSRRLSLPFGGVWLGCVGSSGARPAPIRQVLPVSGDTGGLGRGAGRCEPGVQEVPVIRNSQINNSSLLRLKPVYLRGLPMPL